MSSVAPPLSQAEGPPPMGDNPYYEPFSVSDMLLDLALNFLLDLMKHMVTAPADRLLLLSTVEGELKSQGRLPVREGFGGIVACAKRIWEKEGFLGFFRGALTDTVLSLPLGIVNNITTNAVVILVRAVVPKHVLNSMSHPQIIGIWVFATTLALLGTIPYKALHKSIVTNYTADIVSPIAIGSGCGAGAVTQGDTCEDKRTKQEPSEVDTLVETYQYLSATEAARSIYRRHGLRGFYRGALLDPIAICAYRGLYMAGIFLISHNLYAAYPYGVTQALFFVADIVTHPLEVVSCRMILTASDDAVMPYTGVANCVKTIVHTEGVSGLWSGIRCRLVVSALTSSIRIAFAQLFSCVRKT